ncbi:glycerophosphodiester phosphodiesterase [Lacticaseibacillus pabuli]|uniref:Glycerophosphodiester phosphodiesterase n=1 Tax=Lacticaseibacillus pabuli TaxID=3025672 RepID=A0ABY7WQF3_9LACO|nr:glycerophosphodiester phosphodiesterase [Lacticaseibacillus sp. KACC 23028]WDF82427.1 glycerophosphodiester phosphodiesterase [Lacticaseibacillus sp. KACC 23028]
MKSIRYAGDALREFWAQWANYLVIVWLVLGVTDLALVPLLRWTVGEMLVAAGVPYIGFDNILGVITGHVVLTVGLILLGLVMLVLVYAQFSFLLGGVQGIRQRQAPTLKAIAREAWSDLQHLRIGSFVFFVFYFLLVIPFAGTVVGSSLLAKVQIPTFIMEWIGTKPLLAFLVFAFYLVMAYLGLRWILVLPNTVLKNQPLRKAAGESWRQTSGHFWFYFWRTFWLTLILQGITFVFTQLLIWAQTGLDKTPVAYIGAIITMTILLLGKMVLGGMSSAVFLIFLTAPVYVKEGQIANAAKHSLIHYHGWMRRVTLVVGTVILLSIILFNGIYLYGGLDHHPLTISHRGVDNGNGVQNTIPALRKTARERPDYVEMDVHETRDHQFIVLHDENLKDLAGIDKRPSQMTLAQLKRVTVRENGHHAKLASLGAYMTAAERAHQRLIVEIKPTQYDSKDMLSLFIKRYGQRLIHNHDRVHSLSYSVINRLHHRLPKLYVSFILPYSITLPNTHFNAYTLEESTLNSDMVGAAQARGQAVWAWTVNDQDEMEQMMFAQADGIITDRLGLLKKTISENNDHPSYAQRLRLFSDTFDKDDTGTVEN